MRHDKRNPSMREQCEPEVRIQAERLTGFQALSVSQLVGT